MSNITVGQIIMEAQRLASGVKDADALSSALLVEAEGNNRLVESLRQFQDDMDSLNRISNNKSNAEMVNRIQQQNANSSEILKENRELKICIEDYERAMEMIMQKYREHTATKVLDTKINFRDVYNERLWQIIREQREKINEMAAVMQRAAAADEDAVNVELEHMSRLRLENKTLRELLQISKQFGSAQRPIRFNEHLLEEKAVQTTETSLTAAAFAADVDSAADEEDELSLSGASLENANNNSVIQLTTTAAAATTNTTVIDNAPPPASSSSTSSSALLPAPLADAASAAAAAVVSDNNNGDNNNSLSSDITLKLGEKTKSNAAVTNAAVAATVAAAAATSSESDTSHTASASTSSSSSSAAVAVAQPLAGAAAT